MAQPPAETAPRTAAVLRLERLGVSFYTHGGVVGHDGSAERHLG